MLLLHPPFAFLPPLEIRATELVNALPRIGDRFGVGLRAAPAIEREIVVARLDRGTLPEVKERLAEEFASEWRTSADGTFILRPDPKLRQDQERTWRRERIARVHIARMALTKTLAELPALSTADGAAYRAEMNAREAAGRAGITRKRLTVPLTPMRRLALRIVTGLADTDLESGEPETRDVFSTAPTRLQRPLPLSAAEAVRAYVDERSRFDDPDVPPPSAATVTARVLRRADGIAVTVRVLDPRGVVIGSAVQGLDLREALEPVPAPSTLVPYRFEPTQETRDAERIFTASTRSPYGEVREILAKEPLGFGASDVLLSAAREADRDLICHPGDEAFAFRIGSGRGDLMRWLDGSPGGVVSLVGERWLRVRTGDPWPARRAFVERTTLAKLVAAFGGRKPSLADQAALAPLLPPRGYGETAETFVWIASANDRLTSFALVKLYASLVGVDRDALRGGIGIGRLPRAADDLIREEIFRGDTDLARYGEGADADATSGLDEPTTLFGRSADQGGVAWEDGILAMEVHDDAIVLVPRNGEPQSLTVEGLAGLVGDPRAAAKYGFDLSALRVTSRESADFHLRWKSARSGVWGADLTLPGPNGETDPRTYNVSNLPTEVRHSLDRALERRRSETGTTPPP